MSYSDDPAPAPTIAITTPAFATMPASALVIVIFGAAVRSDGAPSTALRRRVHSALRFGRAQRDVIYLPTGGVGRHGPSEASVMAQLLQAAGVPAGDILLEETGTSTLTSVQGVARALRARDFTGPVYAASNAYHLPRCVLLMLMAGLDAWACPAPQGRAARSLRMRWFWRLREAVAVPVDLGAAFILRLRGKL